MNHDALSATNLCATELCELLERLCEDRLTPDESDRLESLVLHDPAARALYLDYMDLHGSLYWDAAAAGDVPAAGPAKGLLEETLSELCTCSAAAPQSGIKAIAERRPRWLSRAGLFRAGASAAAAACLLLGWLYRPLPNAGGIAGPNPVGVSVAHTGGIASDSADAGSAVAKVNGVSPASVAAPELVAAATRVPELVNGGLAGAVPSVRSALPAETTGSAPQSISQPPVAVAVTSRESAATLVTVIDEQIRAGWQAAGVTPSPRADDSEWLRRVYLDIAGHIPPIDVLERFLADKSAGKRIQMVERLLDEPSYVRNFSTQWAKLLVGQKPPADVNRQALLGFLRRSFARNIPWNDVVSELLTAEGRADENGAANFLLAHLNGGAIPATAITSRLFLGRQMQCTQCHNHPFNSWKQEQFWELNGFFQQLTKVPHEKYDAKTGRMLVEAVELTSRETAGPVYFETRTGLMKVAYPKFGETAIDPGADTNRTRELARILTDDGSSQLLAEAFVNRTWAQFLGQGFTRRVDDMGPHSPPSHPELLTRLSREFIQSGYDVKQLIRWICQSEAYQLTSRLNDGNEIDDALNGEPALFSHMYVKSMTAEQLYDSLLVATQAQVRWEEADQRRQAWLQQFVMTFDTEENDEASTFNGSIPQSLMMMNSELMDNAVSTDRGTYLHKILAENSTDTEKINKLYLSALSRYPSPKELAAIKKLLRAGPAHQAGEGRQRLLAQNSAAFEDVYWAFLNSNEFILNH